MKLKIETIGKGQPATIKGNSMTAVLSLPPMEDYVREDLVRETKLALRAGWAFDRMEHEINKVIDRFTTS